MQQKSLQKRCWIRQHRLSSSWICDVTVSQVNELVFLDIFGIFATSKWTIWIQLAPFLPLFLRHKTSYSVDCNCLFNFIQVHTLRHWWSWPAVGCEAATAKFDHRNDPAGGGLKVINLPNIMLKVSIQSASGEIQIPRACHIRWKCAHVSCIVIFHQLFHLLQAMSKQIPWNGKLGLPLVFWPLLGLGLGKSWLQDTAGSGNLFTIHKSINVAVQFLSKLIFPTHFQTVRFVVLRMFQN